MTRLAADVLIVGAGPTGLTMALELALHNISFRIIEKSPTPSDKSRALVIHPRSLELLNRHGLAETLVQESTVGTGARVYVNKKQTMEMDFSDLGFENTAYPRPIWISQADTESILASHLEATYGGVIERGAVASEINQDDTGADVIISKDDQSESFRFRYVVGCDGAHSAVRHAAGMSFEGAPYPQDFILCDAHLEWDRAKDGAKPLTVFLGPTGLLVMFPMKEDTVRLVASRPSDVLNGRDPGSDPTVDDFKTLISKMIPGEVELHDVFWLASFRLHHRGVDTYRKKRLFVAGDAAHIHSPAGGQGMNTGIQDAVNLGWKLAHVIYRERDGKKTKDHWLDSYDEERRRVGMHLLNGTDRIFGYGSSTNYFWVMWRNFVATWVLPRMLSTRERRGTAFRFISQLGIRYRFSPITRASNGTLLVKGGDRAPDSKVRLRSGEEKWLSQLCEGEKHHLILFSGLKARSMKLDEMDAILARFDEIFSKSAFTDTKTHKVYASSVQHESGLSDVEDKLHGVFGFQAPGVVFLRPDGYVACIDFISQVKECIQWVKEYCDE